MSKHLPECEWNDDTRVNRHCICPALRACEQRVAGEIWGAIRDGSQYKSGFEGGLDAARDAVAALPHDTYCVTRDENYKRPCNCPVDEAIAAIDALRGES